LNIQQHTFLTENSILANAATEMTVELNQIPWKIRRHVAEFRQLVVPCSAAIYHIKRELN
jgi:hypothetical protein